MTVLSKVAEMLAGTFIGDIDIIFAVKGIAKQINNTKSPNKSKYKLIIYPF